MFKNFTSDDKFVINWASEGSTDKVQFLLPHDIAIDSSDNVYIADTENVHPKKRNAILFFR